MADAFAFDSRPPASFISYCAKEAADEAHALRCGLLEYSPTSSVTLSPTRRNDPAAAARARDAIHSADLIIILGTTSFGTKTDAVFNTYEELQLIFKSKKSVVLLQMCPEFSFPATRCVFSLMPVRTLIWTCDRDPSPPEHLLYTITGLAQLAANTERSPHARTARRYDAGLGPSLGASTDTEEPPEAPIAVSDDEDGTQDDDDVSLATASAHDADDEGDAGSKVARVASSSARLGSMASMRGSHSEPMHARTAVLTPPPTPIAAVATLPSTSSDTRLDRANARQDIHAAVRAIHESVQNPLALVNALQALATCIRRNAARTVPYLTTDYPTIDVITAVMLVHPGRRLLQRLGCFILKHVAAFYCGDVVYSTTATVDAALLDLSGILHKVMLDFPAVAVAAMLEFPGDPKLQKYACQLLDVLVRAHAELRTCVVHTGGLPAVVVAMERHPRRSGIQHAGCKVVAELTRRGTVSALDVIQAGGLDAVRDAVWNHVDDAAVVTTASECMATLVAAARDEDDDDDDDDDVDSDIGSEIEVENDTWLSPAYATVVPRWARTAALALLEALQLHRRSADVNEHGLRALACLMPHACRVQRDLELRMARRGGERSAHGPHDVSSAAGTDVIDSRACGVASAALFNFPSSEALHHLAHRVIACCHRA
ncbi:hypothetical protein PTSG_05095 [Salpingoeca rosetta]|uniref:Uncharacterized protein n=1 Tax=Salpingoeca rosetta (strain ATCC 50818 / BSB-021) TaxID=946362 RepID=F2UAI4_SALR5|nr:uncharacterized protein PTSG_05095 [Salpingoeca rosetta]EGD73400.1 hypothetical protein PTSG_05095 [Salpingoeca rosetta]|eukprot:XP_004993682.1 hypothetical protein PTSG_05095 [Salpingoeca rosetta]